MAIASRDQLINALANNASRIVIDKATLASQAAGTLSSLWRAIGTPGQGAIPAAAAICTKALTGAIGFTNQTAPANSYIAWLWAVCSNNTQTLEVHDRIAHMGGLNLTLLTAQTVGLDVQTLGVPSDRIGSAGFDDLQWWYEVYTAGGATASNATFNVTFDDASTGTLSTLAVGGSVAASRIFSLDALKTGAQQARKIRGVNSMTLSASTGTAGSVGVTVTRPRMVLPMPLANFSNVADWAATGLPDVPNDACLALIVLNSTTSTGIVRGGGKIVHG
jgi:hypothetical protein